METPSMKAKHVKGETAESLGKTGKGRSYEVCSNKATEKCGII